MSKWVCRTKKQWREILDAFERSGQSGTVFCREQGMVYSTFCIWRRRLREGKGGDTPVFLPVKTCPEPCIPSGPALKAELPGGVLLTWQSLPNPQWIADLVHAFERGR